MFFRLILLFFCLSLSAQDLTVRNVTLIDGTGAAAQPGMTLVIANGRIEAVGKDVKTPEGGTVIDGSGKYLIPGLWDMHIHWMMPQNLTLFLANGVTGTRNMFGSPMIHNSWRKLMKEGRLLGPHMVLGSRIVDGPQPIWPGSVAVDGPESGRKAVTTVKEEGADFVKVYSLLSRESFFAIAEEARKQGMKFAGHVPIGVRAAEAADAGMHTMEHMYGLLAACATTEDQMFAEVDVMLASGQSDRQAFGRVQSYKTRHAQHFDEKKADALAAKLVENGTWLCPTLVVMRNMANADDPEQQNDARMAYMPGWIRNFWNPKNDFRLKNKTEEQWAQEKKNYREIKKLVGILHRKGVRFIAGTDVLNPHCYPGFSLHDELVLMVEAGLSPMDALLAATRNAADAGGRLTEVGTLEKGKLADMVLLDADPLDDIANTKKIHAVVFGGKYHDRKALNAWLEEAKKLAAGP
ncbi:MAG: amidohydrolase family protein [Acidobacteriota bacterium]|nr:amidohydrolase family protein [Acidobacteriota bacterium]